MAKTRTPKSVEQNRQILEAIARHAATSADIAEVTGMHDSTIKELLKVLRKAERVHVADWEWTPGATRASRMYLAGPGEDAEYPTRRVESVWPMVKESELTPEHGWAPIRKVDRAPIIQRDPMVAAIFGEYQGAGA